MSSAFDVAVVGGRCGGAASGLLLARKGYRVLLVEQAAFPADTLSTHFLQPSGVQRLASWGLLPALEATRAPPVARFRVAMDGIEVGGSPRLASGALAVGYCVRRHILDELLLRAAVAAGVDVREQVRMTGLEWAEGRVVGIRLRARTGESIERASVVIGADGMRSATARHVQAASYEVTPPLTCVYYSYWADFACSAAELHSTADLGVGVYPTNDGLTCIAVAWPNERFARFRADVEGGVMSSLDRFGSVGERARAGRRAERYRGTTDVPSFFRTCQGPGWALVGDAAHHKDPITGQGMSDAFHDAELLADCIDADLRAGGRFGGQTRYEQARTVAALDQHRLTCRIAALQPVAPERRPFYQAVAASRALSDAYVEMVAGLHGLDEFTARCLAAGLLPTRSPPGSSPPGDLPRT